ncbi:MAG TPA: TRAM domain-containing protein [Vicinamibacterales bacterium]|nr:TRAM domain-containing protein [Vicinamibacterales bacterium]
MLIPGHLVELDVEKPAAGGRMIARHDGQVVFVHGAIPGERVRARVERVERQLAFAAVDEVLSPSPDRRAGLANPRCGGAVYSHIVYARQLALKADLISDAFTRLGRLPLEAPVAVAASPEHGYRMRARFHVQGATIGFFESGSHTICDAASTGQVTAASVAAAEGAVTALNESGATPVSVELAENMTADERALFVEVEAHGSVTVDTLTGLAATLGLTGCAIGARDGTELAGGTPVVADPLERVTGLACSGMLRRHVQSFFQGNRFLITKLVTAVLDAAPASGSVVDLYAGVGLFAVALAAAGRTAVTAVESQAASAGDLRQNAAQFGGAVRVWDGRVEHYLATARRAREETIIVDPPRTGISRDAMQAVAARAAGLVVYVSCDPATMARDARRLVDAGYVLRSLTGFDLFPNTPHVEALGVFARA